MKRFLPQTHYANADKGVMDTAVESFGWYAVQVASKKEKMVASVLTEKGFECFLPTYPKRTAWSDRVKVVDTPLFSGYVFSRFDVNRRLPILVTPNVFSIVGNGKVPASIPAGDLDAIRAALSNGVPVEPCDCLHEGDPVRVKKGPLTGFEGTFVSYRSAGRLILSVPLIQRSVAVELDRLWIEPISKTARLVC